MEANGPSGHPPKKARIKDAEREARILAGKRDPDIGYAREGGIG